MLVFKSVWTDEALCYVTELGAVAAYRRGITKWTALVEPHPASLVVPGPIDSAEYAAALRNLMLHRGYPIDGAPLGNPLAVLAAAAELDLLSLVLRLFADIGTKVIYHLDCTYHPTAVAVRRNHINLFEMTMWIPMPVETERMVAVTLAYHNPKWVATWLECHRDAIAKQHKDHLEVAKLFYRTVCDVILVLLMGSPATLPELDKFLTADAATAAGVPDLEWYVLTQLKHDVVADYVRQRQLEWTGC